MIESVAIALVSLIFFVYFILAIRIYKGSFGHSIKQSKIKPQCFGFLKDKSDDYDLSSSPYNCQGCNWLLECMSKDVKK